MSAYPKVMLRGSEEVTATCESDERSKMAEGYRAVVDPLEPVAEAVDPATDDEPDGPTYGAAHDQTHEKRSKKKK